MMANFIHWIRISLQAVRVMEAYGYGICNKNYKEFNKNSATKNY